MRIARILAAVAGLLLAVLPAPASTAAEAPAALPGSIGPAPSQQYVQVVHRLFLGRDASPAELGSAAHVLHAAGPVALTGRLALSAEWAGLRIDELYRRVLGREPEPGGRDHWLGVLAAGRTLESVAAAFHGSDERYARVGATPGAFVDALYRELLGREPDAEGREAWIGRLRAGMSRTDVAVSFYGSVESRRQRVEALYRDVLGRAADRSGREHWVGALPRLGDVALASHLAASDELHRRATGGVPFADVGVAAVGAGTPYPLTASWRAGCPVGPGDLRAVTFPHWRPDGSVGRGVLIVHRDAVGDVAALVRAAWGTRFPITQARPVDDFGGDDDASMAADNTSAFNCRRVAGTTTWSQHAYGRAVDVNPVRNPYVRGGEVDPPAGAAWTDRGDVRPGMLVEGGGVVDAVDRLGWGWGGRWSSSKDFQHLSRNGR
ncbi:MAG: DUF4214 domain-containing protein [Acidimicrobiia bacterium]